MVFKYNGGSIAWRSQRQNCIALSTTEAEFIAASHAAKEAIWLNNLLRELCCVTSVPSLQMDNQSAIPRLRIVWRNSPFQPIQDFRLTRIAYGTASAPYFAIQCLQQLAINESNNFPFASKAAVKDFYVDDLMSRAN
ncbi:retrovirus-related Pol polyprotein from transposon TNT 1-94 [Trichonephila clavipes]|nr:retrovirus-related Pol polyprotein from transposon TNT 1-94 [Trichonephila clavipes]